MYDTIKEHFEKKLNEAARIIIRRPMADKESIADTKLISEHATSILEHHLKEIQDDIKTSEVYKTRREAVDEVSDSWAMQQFDKHFRERTSIDVNSPIKTFDLAGQCRTRVLGTPYDRDWSEGNGVGVFSRFDGGVYAIPKVNGFSAAGIGFNLTTDKPVLTSIVPQGTFRWSWSAFTKLPPHTISRGGLGITIYTDSHPQPTLSRQPILWTVNDNVLSVISGETGNGRIADAASPAFGFGQIPLAPALLNMVPGSRYLVWVWCWQVLQTEGDGKGFFSIIDFDMPFVTLDACPPIYLH